MHNSGDIGYCAYVGHTGCIELTWDDNTVVSVECEFGDHNTCGYSNECGLYQRRPVGFIQTYPAKKN